MNELIENYHADAIKSFRMYKSLAEKAIAQISDEEFLTAIDDEANSIALIVKHIAGNQISRWTDFLTSDGEKPDRHRDAEFEMIDDTRLSLMEFWERGWQTLFGAVEPLTPDDFSRSVTIRGEPHSIADDALRVSRRSDRVACKTFQVRRMENPKYPEKQVRGL